MNDREPLALMSAAERADYCRFLSKMAGQFQREPGPVSLYLKRAATELAGRFM